MLSSGGLQTIGRPGLRLLAVAAMVVMAILAEPGQAAAEKYAAIIVDANTGKTLFSRYADARRYPASLTKIMTLYLAFEALERGEITMSTRWKVSSRAAGQAPSKLGLKAGSTIGVKDAIMALVTKSANDVAVVVAEGLAGSEAAFARRMTDRARQLGMSRTTFKNASGLPNSGQVTTARDMALLGRAVQDAFPQYFELFSTRSYTINGRRYGNHNRLLGKVKGVDGIKTGYTRASGFNLVSSVNRGNRSIVAVVMGGRTARTRDKHMTEIIGKYIGRASNGKRTAPLIAAAGGVSNPFRISLDEMPMPRTRPGTGKTASPFAVAAATAMPEADPIDQIVRMAEGDADDGADGQYEGGNPVARAFAALEPNTPAAPAAPAAPTQKAMDGWKIQVGALPSEAGAMDRIQKARTAMPALLGDLSPYTETVTKGSNTLYRARFAGFAGKDAARDACRQLKRKAIECIALR